ncbi:MAG: hypothetical protein ABI068_06480 [Ktedonobacterales bacterium]
MRLRYANPFFAIAVLFVVVILSLVGCGGAVQSEPPPITLADTSPVHLDANIGITIGGYDAASRNLTEIAVQFTANGRLVQFQKGEMLACGGAAPVVLTTGFDHRYPTAAVAGRPFTCVYTSGKTTANLQFMVPNAPAIIAPIEGATVARSGATLVHFQAKGAIEGIVALGSQSKVVAVITAPGIASVDTSKLNAGSGSVTLTQFPSVGGLSARAFASVHANCTAIAQTEVIWN